MGLAQRLMRPRANPLSRATVVVQGQGMERWIAQSIARDYGVCANTEFLFPRGLLDRVFTLALLVDDEAPSPPANLAWEVDRLVWSVAAQLEAHLDESDLARVKSLLDTPDRDWRLVQLSGRIARLFDDYITYRPDWVERWAKGKPAQTDSTADPDEVWQRFLFGRLVAELGHGHRADCARWFRLRAERDDEKGLPERLAQAFPNAIEIFAVSTLPPLYLSVVNDLARFVDVHLSVLSPSRQYWKDLWGEIRDESQTHVGASQASVPGLLAGLGRLGSDFQGALEELLEDVGSDQEAYQEPDVEDEPSLLRRVQAQMLDLQPTPDSAQSSGQACVISAEDRSIEIHRCHGPKRELEAVRTAIEDAFDADPELTPEDVIVMAPRIDTLAPAIDAVFSGSRETSLPYRIADRGALSRSVVADAFAALLGLLSGRAERTQVLDWLSLEPARSRLGLAPDDVDEVRVWAERAGVRFGWDAEHRAALGLERNSAHTWSSAIDRLVLGHAFGSTGESHAGISPEPLGRFLDRSLLGPLGEFQRTLSAARVEIGQPRSVTAWAVWLLRLLDATLDRRNDNAHEHSLVRSAIARISDAAEVAGFDQAIPFEAIRERVVSAIESAPAAQAFLSGGITFCELVPLRAIPFRVIAIVGLDDLSFPRRSAAPHFDLMARYPRAGDRTSRSDDRYLFLEALLSARDRLILTVPGRDLRDGIEQPMSVVLSELLDAIDATFFVERPLAGDVDGGRPSDSILIDHPLQSYSPRYFETDADPRLHGLDAEAFAGAQTRRSVTVSDEVQNWRFLTREVDVATTASDSGSAASIAAEAEGEASVLSLESLAERIFRSTRYFARERLVLRVPRPEESLSDFDPEDLDALAMHSIGNALLRMRIEGAPRAEVERRLAAQARLPRGEPGRLAAAALMREVERLVSIADTYASDGKGEVSPFDLSLSVVPDEKAPERVVHARLAGSLPELGERGALRVDFGRIGRRTELDLWLEHLVRCAVDEEAGRSPSQSVLIGRPVKTRSDERVVLFAPVEDAKRELETLVGWALAADHRPLRFFPKASLKFAQRMREGKEEMAWRDAQREFYGSGGGDHDFPEIEEGLELALVWAGSRPLEESDEASGIDLGFAALAQRFFDAFIGAREVVRR